MKRLLALTFVLGLGALTWATDSVPVSQGAVGSEAALRGSAPTSRITKVMTEAGAQIEAIEMRAAGSVQADGEAAQREIESLKLSAERQRLQILAEECRHAGRMDEAQAAENELARLDEAPIARQPVEALSLEEKQALNGDAMVRKVVPIVPGAASSTEGGAQ